MVDPKQQETKDITMVLTINQDGIVTKATLNGKAYKHNPTEEEVSLVGNKLASIKVTADGSCCWKSVGGVPKCREEYCVG